MFMLVACPQSVIFAIYIMLGFYQPCNSIRSVSGRDFISIISMCEEEGVILAFFCWFFFVCLFLFFFYGQNDVCFLYLEVFNSVQFWEQDGTFPSVLVVLFTQGFLWFSVFFVFVFVFWGFFDN